MLFNNNGQGKVCEIPSVCFVGVIVVAVIVYVLKFVAYFRLYVALCVHGRCVCAKKNGSDVLKLIRLPKNSQLARPCVYNTQKSPQFANKLAMFFSF